MLCYKLLNQKGVVMKYHIDNVEQLLTDYFATRFKDMLKDGADKAQGDFKLFIDLAAENACAEAIAVLRVKELREAERDERILSM